MRIRTRPRATKIAASSRASPPLERKFAARRRSRRRERENLRGRKENPRIERRTPRRANRRNRRLEPDGFPALVRAGAAVVLPTSMRTSQTTLPRLGAHFLAPAVASRHSLARARSGGWLSSSRSRGRSESARGGGSSGPGPGRGSGGRRVVARVASSCPPGGASPRGSSGAGSCRSARGSVCSGESPRSSGTKSRRTAGTGAPREAARPSTPRRPRSLARGDAPPMRSLVRC